MVYHKEIMFRAAVIGCGMIAGCFEDLEDKRVYSHGKAYRENKHFSQVGFFDIIPERADAMAKRFQGTVLRGDLFTSIVAFNPHVISICTPDQTHFALLEKFLSFPTPALKIIFVEKPVCLNQNELLALETLSNQSQIKIFVNHSRRFDTRHNDLARIIQEGSLGNLVDTMIDYYGGWLHIGVHIIDFLNFVWGDIVTFNSAEYACDSKYPNDPTLNIHGRIGEAPLTLRGFREEYYQILEFKIMFQNGMVKINDFGNEIQVFRKYLNSENENILVPDSNIIFEKTSDAMARAIETIAGFLTTDSEELVRPFGLEQAGVTMRSLWRGKEKYELQKQ